MGDGGLRLGGARAFRPAFKHASLKARGPRGHSAEPGRPDASARRATQEEAPRHVEIAVIDEAAILLDEARPVLAVIGGVAVPGDGRRLVVQGVQVVEEEQRAEEP